jgi:bifunctional pyridoxal-dependent enzyme with beta-cystathionase and maltose regulon repressor activities
MDLSAYTVPRNDESDGWAAHRRLRNRFKDEGVTMNDGETYRAEKPGFYRLIFAVEETFLVEGVRR